MLSTLPVASLLALVPAVLAHGDHGMPDTPAIRAAGIAHRAKYDAWLAARKTKRDSTWQDEAAIKDPEQECAYYSYAPVTESKSQFPTIWETATIVAGDTAAQEKFNEINSTLPSYIVPKGTANGDFSSFTPTYNRSDPDCWWTFNNCVNSKYDYLKENNVNDIWRVPEPETFGLQFDDGPNCTHNAFYDFLKEQDVTASMFYIGSNVLDWPLQAQRGYQDQHEICVHTWSHQYMTSFSNEQAFAELYYTIKAIKLVTGVTPTCWRAPFGDVDDRIRTIAHGLGLQHMMWEYDSDDWKVGVNGVTQEQVQQNYDDLFAKAANGSFATTGTIMLTHEIRNDTMQLFMDNYTKLKSAFKYLVPIWTAFNITQIYPEANATQAKVFADYVNAHGGSVSALSATPTHTMKDATATGVASTAVILGTAANAVASGGAAASSGASAGAVKASESTKSSGASVVVGGSLALGAFIAAGASLLAL